MSIEIVDLTEENLNDAPEWSGHPFSCKYCVYWEYPEEYVDPATVRKEEMFATKLAWLRRTIKDFGSCGKLLYVDGKGVGYAQYAPPWHLPNAVEYPADRQVRMLCYFPACLSHDSLSGCQASAAESCTASLMNCGRGE